MSPPCLRSLCAAHGEVGWQRPQGSTALQVIGSLTAPPTLAPLLSQVCRTQIQRYQRVTASKRGPAGSRRPLRSPSLTRSRAVGGRGSGIALLPDFFWALPQPERWGLCWGALRGHGGASSWGPGCCPPSRQPLPMASGHGLGRLPADTTILPLLPAGCERGASSRAQLIRGQLFRACDGSRCALRQGPHAPWPRCPPPTWTASPGLR